MQQAIGQLVWYPVGKIKVLCKVKDVKIVYGQPRFLIYPLSGEGEEWKELSSLEPFVAPKVTVPVTRR